MKLEPLKTVLQKYIDTNREIQESVFAILQNVLILAVDNNYIVMSRKQGDDFGNVGIVTLSTIFVEEAKKNSYSFAKRNLKCVIRPASDIEISYVKSLKFSSIVKGYFKNNTS
jgi:hypothetical protein